MQQRAMIAMALSCEPEPLGRRRTYHRAGRYHPEPDHRPSSSELKQAAFSMGLILITHNLGSFAASADRVAVMFRGKIVEYGDTPGVLAKSSAPLHQGAHGLRAKRLHGQAPQDDRL